MKGKKVLSLSMAALLAASMVPATAVSADSKDERTIKVLTIWNENVQGGTQTLKKLSDEYCEQHPEIKVDIEVVAQTDMNSKLSVLAASNELPDLFIEVDTAQANTFITQGLVKNVDEFLADNGLQDILSESTHDGLINLQGTTGVDDLYILPTEQNIEGFWYNKKMFEENGWEVPTTMDEFMKICEDASSKGIQPLSVDGVDKFYFTRLWGGYATSKLGPDALVKANAGELSWSDDAFKEAYQWVADLNDKGYMGAGVTTVDSATMNAVFLKRRSCYGIQWIMVCK